MKQSVRNKFCNVSNLINPSLRKAVGFHRSSKWLNAASGRTRSRMIFRQSPGPCKAASVGGLAYRHIGYFIPLFIGHRERKALIARFFCKLTGNLSGIALAVSRLG